MVSETILAIPSVQEQSMDPISPSFLHRNVQLIVIVKADTPFILQGTVDPRGHFIDVCVGWPG